MTEAPSGFDVGCLPGYCFKYVVTLEGSTIRIWNTLERLAEFMGPVDNRTEAAILAEANDFYWTAEVGGIREVAGGYELVVLSVAQYCAPFRVDQHVVEVSASGTVRVLRSELWSRDNTCV